MLCSRTTTPTIQSLFADHVLLLAIEKHLAIGQPDIDSVNVRPRHSKQINHKGKRHNTYIAPQAATVAAAELYLTDTAGK